MCAESAVRRLISARSPKVAVSGLGEAGRHRLQSSAVDVDLVDGKPVLGIDQGA